MVSKVPLIQGEMSTEVPSWDNLVHLCVWGGAVIGALVLILTMPPWIYLLCLHIFVGKGDVFL